MSKLKTQDFIITLCGSARFEEEFKVWTLKLTLAGYVVHTLATYPSDQGDKDWYTAEEKAMLDAVYLNKIAASTCILVLDVDNYIGEGCRTEIHFAENNHVEVLYLSKGDADFLLGGKVTK